MAAPLLYGAGTQFKILEALACGAPTITSTEAARSLGATPGCHLLATDDDGEVAAGIVRLIEDRSYGRALGQAGRAFVVDGFAWPEIVGRLDRIYAASAAAAGQTL